MELAPRATLKACAPRLLAIISVQAVLTVSPRPSSGASLPLARLFGFYLVRPTGLFATHAARTNRHRTTARPFPFGSVCQSVNERPALFPALIRSPCSPQRRSGAVYVGVKPVPVHHFRTSFICSSPFRLFARFILFLWKLQFIRLFFP